MQNSFDIKKFTSNIAVYLLNAIAETMEFNMEDEDGAIEHIYAAFDRLAITMSNKGIVSISQFKNDNPFILKVAKEIIQLINDDETTYEQMKNKLVKTRDEYVEKYSCDFPSLTRAELENLGFAYWQESNPIMLIPIWAYRLMPTNMELISVSGHKYKAFDPFIRIDRPTDIQYGHLGWGFYLKEGK